VDQLLSTGIESLGDPLGLLLQLGAQRLIQEALEQETTEQLGRAHYQRR